jgi:ankyrin repeat protein
MEDIDGKTALEYAIYYDNSPAINFFRTILGVEPILNGLKRVIEPTSEDLID